MDNPILITCKTILAIFLFVTPLVAPSTLTLILMVIGVIILFI